MPLPLSEDENAKRKRLWELGLSDSKIADIRKVSRAAIHDWRVKNGLKSNSKGQGNHLPSDEYELRLLLIKDGYTDAEIASIVGITKQSLTFWRWNKGIYKDTTLSQRHEQLTEEEENLFNYLKDKYPEEKEVHLISLTNFAKPRADITPTVKQRDFVRKIRVPGFKTVYYFDDGEYNCIEEAMELFICLNPHISENMKKIKINMLPELYDTFVNTYRKFKDNLF